MKQVTVVDFKTNANSENEIMAIIKKHGAQVGDWVERDYGIKLFVDVPKGKVDSFKRAVGNTHGVTCG